MILNALRRNILLLLTGIVLLSIALFTAIQSQHNSELKLVESSNRLQQYVYTQEAEFASFFQVYLNDTNNLTERWMGLKNVADKHRFQVQVFKNDTLLYWSSNQINARRYIQSAESGTGFINGQNGFYLFAMRPLGSYKFVVLHELKTHYNYQNEYIGNKWNDALSFLQDALLSPAKVEGYHDIFAIHGTYLFSVKLYQTDRGFKTGMAITILVLLLFTLISFHFLFRRLMFSRPVWATSLFLVFNGVLFYLVKHNWYQLVYIPTNLFSPEVYASSNLLNSLGSFSMVVLFATWYFYMLNERLRLFPETNPRSLASIGVFMFLSVLAADSTFDSIRSLVFDSQINFDLNNIYHTNIFTLIAIVISILLLLVTFLVSSMLFRMIARSKEKTKLYFLMYVLVLLYVQPVLVRYLFERGHYYFFESTLYLITLFGYHYLKTKLNRFQGYFLMITLLSFYSSINLYHWNHVKEEENRKLFANKLVSQNDMATEYFLKSVEQKIITDKYVKFYFLNNYSIKSIFEKRLRQLYFTGYLSRYEVSFFEFDSSGTHHLQIRNPYSYQQLNDAYRNAIRTIDSYSRYLPNTSGLKGYLSKIPIMINRHVFGYLFIQLQPKLMQDDNRFDELLIEGYRQNRFYRNEYSFAIYQHQYIVNQSGNFPYRITNAFPVKLGEYTFVESGGFEHLVFSENGESVIVVSKPAEPFYAPFALFSLEFTCFTLLLSFMLVLYTLSNWGPIRRIIPKGNLVARRIRLFINGFMGMDDPEVALIRTRIQASIVLIVFFTLAITAYFTIGYIIRQYNDKQSELLMRKLRSVVSTVEGENIQSLNQPELEAFINQIGDYYDTDITIYNAGGEMQSTTVRKIYDDEIISSLMNSTAYFHLHYLKESQFNQTEQIASFNYSAGYVPILKNKNEVLGYIQLPYFSKQLDLLKEISSLAFGFINLYAVLFIVMGLLAFFISRNISNPLILLQRQLARTTLGKNEPIHWKGRDEIGELVKQYNIMISKLEESAQMLAQSERETAWRDIARQIAHEIKNPLTPMKLSVQHLERAWNDQSPKLEETFRRVSKTLIAQIETLSNLATEFSSFARMPDPVLESIVLEPVLKQMTDVFLVSGDADIAIECSESIRVYFDSGYLNRVITNLVKNGIQAVPEDRRPRIDIRVFENADLKTIEINISDNGTGIDSSQADKIFTPYFSTKVSGMGLGLPLVKNMIESAGGSISFQNNAVFGTTFQVVLPSESSLKG